MINLLPKTNKNKLTYTILLFPDLKAKVIFMSMITANAIFAVRLQKSQKVILLLPVIITFLYVLPIYTMPTYNQVL